MTLAQVNETIAEPLLRKNTTLVRHNEDAKVAVGTSLTAELSQKTNWEFGVAEKL
jgi:hypothetical protein